jgi:2'-5' RNA ligase
MPRSALIVEVPEAEPAVGEWRLRYDNARLGIPAHITLLFPFVPVAQLDQPVYDELQALVATQPAISYSLTQLQEFPDQTLWLTPEPAEPFRKLTELIFASFPAYPPYEGIHDDVIPHLTVSSGDASLRDDLSAAVLPQLPIEAEAGEVTLLVEDESGHWRRERRFPLASEGTRPGG